MPTKLRDQDNFEDLNKSVLEILETPKDETNTAIIADTAKTDSKIEQNNSIKLLRKKKRFSIGRFISITIILFCVILLVLGGSFVYNILAAASETTGGGKGDIWSTLKNSLNPTGFERVTLQGENEGRTNFLVLGVDSAAGLSDTIMLVSYYYKEQKIATMSIPRDFYVTDGYGTYRINAVYPFAENRNPGSGPQAVSDFVSKELEIPIHYWMVVNFDGVEQIVDAVGGIEVNVPTAFIDYQYPTRNYSGYIRPAPSFETGMQYMNGERALIYARSRYGNNGTGSDFDRGRRQAEVGEGILQKLKSKIDSGEIMNINSINALIGSARNNVKTSVNINEIMSAYELFKDQAKNQDNIFDNYYSINWFSGNGFLCSPPLEKYGASVVTYCDGGLGGGRTYSAGRQKAREMAQNLLDHARFADLSRTSTIILANRSSLTAGIETELRTLPLGTVWDADNYYRYIPQATGTEKVNIYIANDQIRAQFKEASEGKLTFAYELHSGLPAEKTLTSNNVGSDIIVWIE